MDRKKTIQILHDIQAGRHNRESLQQTLQTLDEDFIRDHRQMIQAYEMAEKLDPGFADKFNSRMKAIGDAARVKYGNDATTWPDSFFEEMAATYQESPVYSALLECIHENHFENLIKSWTPNAK